MVQWPRFCASSSGDPGSIPGQETTSHMSQLRFHMPQLKIVQLLSGVGLFETPWTAVRQNSLSFTNSQSLLKLMSIELVMPSRPLSSSSSAFSLSQHQVFSSEVALPIRWPKYWSFSISPSCEYSGLISFRVDWFNLLAVQDPSCCKENPRSLLHAATKIWHNQIKIIFKKLIFLVIINKEGSFLARLTTKNT